MNFTDNNPLSMTGEDSFTSINEILARCVLIDTNQTILSNKIFDASTTTTFDGDVEMNGTTDNTGVINNTGTLIVGGTLNLNTDIVADKPSLNFTNTGSTIINPSNIMALQVAGTDKFVTDAMNTAIYGTSQISFSAGTSTTTMSTATFQNNFGTQQLFSVNSQQKLQLQNTNTTLNNTTTSIQSGGTTKISVGASTTALNNDTTNIQVAGTNRVTIDGTTTGLNNTTTNIQSGGTNKITINATGTTLNNDTTKIQSGGIDKIDISSTNSYLTNTAGISLVTNGTGVVQVNPLFSIFQNTDQYLQDVNGVNRLSLSTASLLTTNPVVTHTYSTSHTIEFGGNQTALTMLPLSLGLVVNSVAKESVDTTTTTLSNATISLRDGQATPVTRFTQTNGATTITNTAIDLTASGTTGAITLTGGGTSLTNGINLDSVGNIRIDSDNDVNIASSTDVNILVPAGSARATFTSATTSLSNTTSITMNHPTTTIQSASSAKLTITGSTTTSTNTTNNLTATENVNITCGALYTAKIKVGSNDIITATASAVNVANEIGTQGYNLGSAGELTFPLVSFALQMTQDDFSVSNFQLVMAGFPNADFANRVYSLRMPFRMKCVGWSISGDGDAHSAVQITCKLNSGTGSGGGTTYFSQTNSLSANAIQSNSATASINGFINNFATPPGAGTFTASEIPAGTRIYGWVETSATFASEFIVTYFFQQVI